VTWHCSNDADKQHLHVVKQRRTWSALKLSTASIECSAI